MIKSIHLPDLPGRVSRVPGGSLYNNKELNITKNNIYYFSLRHSNIYYLNIAS